MKLTISLVALALLIAFAPASAAAQESDEVQRGAALLRAADEGRRDCSDLSDSDFEAVGEYAMERMVGSPQAHAAMDRTISSMMGEGGLGQMHRLMGQRFTRCGGGTMPAGFGGMMGAIGMMGGGFGAGPGGDYGGGPGAYGPGMMGGSGGSDGDSNGGWDWAAATLMMLVLVAGLIAWSIVSRRWRPGPGGDARSILDRRLAAGDIDKDEYESRLSALAGR